jgi:hypothetical protein
MVGGHSARGGCAWYYLVPLRGAAGGILQPVTCMVLVPRYRAALDGNQTLSNVRRVCSYIIHSYRAAAPAEYTPRMPPIAVQFLCRFSVAECSELMTEIQYSTTRNE